MAVRFGNALFLISFFYLYPFIATPAHAGPIGNAISPAVSAVASAVCIDPWHKTQPCRSPAFLLSNSAGQGRLASNWWLTLWSTTGEVAATPRLVFGGKPASCGGVRDAASLFKLDFSRFQLNMDVDTDTEDRFDTVRLAYRSCWR